MSSRIMRVLAGSLVLVMSGIALVAVADSEPSDAPLDAGKIGNAAGSDDHERRSHPDRLGAH